ncbi:MAG: c-type cytochrome [Candidatus Wallbacteria bacterium]|nr:c-type cytochrome [Candidatus Wallbacteria bacterium]
MSLAIATPRREGSAGLGVIVGIVACCAIALVMEVFRAHQEAPGGVSYGFEQIELRLAAANALSPAQQRGRIRYDRYCAICHGSEGRGDGGNAFQLADRPADFGSSAFQARLANRVAVVGVIRDGGPSAGRSVLMPPWNLTLRGSEIDDVVTYVEYLSGKAVAPHGTPKEKGGK